MISCSNLRSAAEQHAPLIELSSRGRGGEHLSRIKFCAIEMLARRPSLDFTLARCFHVLGRLHVEARVSVNVTEVVMDLFNAGDVLSCDNCRLAYMIVEYNSVKMNNSVPDGGLKPGRTPIRCANRSCDTIANMIVVCSWI